MTRALGTKYNLNISKKKLPNIGEILFNEIKHEINCEIIENIYISDGWYRVEKGLQDWNDREIKDWLIEHCHNQHHVFHDRCLFKVQEDAVLFRLTWG